MDGGIRLNVGPRVAAGDRPETTTPAAPLAVRGGASSSSGDPSSSLATLPQAADHHRDDPELKPSEMMDQDFIEEPPREFMCPVAMEVLEEPYQTRCCGNHLSEKVARILQHKRRPCPICKNGRLAFVYDKFHRRRVMALAVRCPHRSAGCEWTGELGDVGSHLNAGCEDGKCPFVSVDCPYSCGERMQRREIAEHKSQHCPLRPFTCQYCNHEATHQEVTKEHWPVCEKYPLPCPNECGEEEIERQLLKGHLEQTCSLEVIQCEFNYAGCGAQLQRRLMPTHVKENVEAHLSMVCVFCKEQASALTKQEDALTRHLADAVKHFSECIDQLSSTVKRQQKQLEDILPASSHAHPTNSANSPIASFVMDNFSQRKRNETTWYSPPFFSGSPSPSPSPSPCPSSGRGYKMCLRVNANGCEGAKGTHVSVYVKILPGEFDGSLEWPFHGEVTIGLLNQAVPEMTPNGDQCYRMTVPFTDGTPLRVCGRQALAERGSEGWGFSHFIPHRQLWPNWDRRPAYLKDDCLKFAVLRVMASRI